MIDHDRLFKELLTTFFAEFVELFLPNVSAHMERDSVEFLDKELFSDITAGEKHVVFCMIETYWQVKISRVSA